MTTNSDKPPVGTCDSHAHVLFAPDKYPYIPSKVFEPEEALPEDYWRMADGLGITRVVITAPSAYGTNNEALLDAIAARPESTRGVASVAYDIDFKEMERLDSKGVRGIRCNVVDLKQGKGVLDIDSLTKFASRIKPLGWHIEFLLHVDEYPDLDTLFKDFPVPVSFGHFGYVTPTTKGTDDAGFQALLRLVRDSTAYVKLTAPYRLTASNPPYPEVDEFAGALIDANPDQLLWGSDWPFVVPLPGGPTGSYRETGLDRPKPETKTMYERFRTWTSEETAHKILVENPNRLYQFDR